MRDKQPVLAVIGVLLAVIAFVWVANVVTAPKVADPTATGEPTSTASTTATDNPSATATATPTPTQTPKVLAGCTEVPAPQAAPQKRRRCQGSRRGSRGTRCRGQSLPRLLTRSLPRKPPPTMSPTSLSRSRSFPRKPPPSNVVEPVVEDVVEPVVEDVTVEVVDEVAEAEEVVRLC
jgi:hypothetical protein